MSTIIRSDRRLHALLVIAIAIASPSLAHAQEAPSSSAPDPLGPLRERFKEGMDRYRAGAFAEAAVIWEAIYRELGPDTGYRLAFNLGRAYDQLGDLIKASEHYETYLGTVKAKREAGITLEANVEKQEALAKDRLDAIAAVKGRIRVKPGATAVVTRIDNAPPRVSGFVVYVEPGPHVVRFAPAGEKEEARELVVKAGEIAEVEPPAPAPRPPPILTPPPGPRYETQVVHPIPSSVLWVSGAVTVASIIIPVITYTSASSLSDDFDAALAAGNYPEQLRIQADYNSARSNAYASLAVPSILAATTVGLVIWYFVGAREKTVQIAPSASVGSNGAAFGASGTF